MIFHTYVRPIEANVVPCGVPRVLWTPRKRCLMKLAVGFGEADV
jgi:hypothetical protein